LGLPANKRCLFKTGSIFKKNSHSKEISTETKRDLNPAVGEAEVP